jgi:hypothetical protein
MAEVHYLKMLEPLFKELKVGIVKLKVFNDRNYKVGDTLILEEKNQKNIDTGAWSPKLITSMGIDKEKGFVILDMKDIKF